jgi:carbamoylphosphate synthase small subunit
MEKRLDRELEDRGVQIRTYHIREKQFLMPFTGVTIVTDCEYAFKEVSGMVMEAMPSFGLHMATRLKTGLESQNIYGIAICDTRDQYNKKRGRIIAKGRLFCHLKGRGLKELKK